MFLIVIISHNGGYILNHFWLVFSRYFATHLTNALWYDLEHTLAYDIAIAVHSLRWGGGVGSQSGTEVV